MAVINETYRGKTVHRIEGEVTGVFFNDLKNPKSYANPRTGVAWTPTKAINLIVDGERVSLGLTDREPPLRAKDADGNYVDVDRGAKIDVVVEENGEYKGVKQWQSRVSEVVVLSPAPAGSSTPRQNNASTANAGGFQKKDDLPIRIGNAITAASFMAGRAKGTVDFDKVLEKANEILPIVDEVRKVLKEEYPKMDDYSLGARLGQCVVVASQHYVKKPEDFADVLPDMFAQVCALEDEIRNPPKEDVPEDAYGEDGNPDSGFEDSSFDDDSIPF